MGPNVGDITIRCDPPRRGRVMTLMVHYEEVQGSPRREDGDSCRRAWIRPMTGAHESTYDNLYCKIMISYKPVTMYEPIGIL